MSKLFDYLKKKFGYTEDIVGIINEQGDIEPVDRNTLTILNEVMRTGQAVEGHVDDKGTLHIKVNKRKKKK